MMKLNDQDVRNQILRDTNQYLVVDASAGSGKTTKMVKKAYWYIDSSYVENYQQILMITFTRLATRQIREKIDELLQGNVTDYIKQEYVKNLMVMTTEGFISSEVIRPFIRDAFGREYPDIEIQVDYTSIFNQYEEGKNQILNNGILGTFRNSTKNFSYQLALEVLKKSYNAREYLKARYPIIMIDEYQDVDSDMHNLFMYLKNNMNIGLFIVGDIKQALYGFRGADPNIFKSLFETESFIRHELITNFRSHDSIIAYSYQFFETDQTVQYDEDKVFLYEPDTDSAESMFLTYINDNPERYVAFLFSRRRQWEEENEIWEDNGFVYLDRPPLDSGSPNYDILEPVLKYYHDGEHYNTFEMLDDMGVEVTKTNEQLADRIRNSFSSQHNIVFNIIEKISNVKITDLEKVNFMESLDDKWRVNFLKEQPKRVAMTIHASKGMEFDHVYVSADSFYPPPNFRGNHSFNEEQHYVAITRAKKSLHIKLNANYERLLIEKGIDKGLIKI